MLIAQIQESSPRNLFLTPDAERAVNIEKLAAAPNLVLDGNAYQGKYEFNPESIQKYLRKEVQKRGYINNDTGEKITLSGRGIDKITGHGMHDDVYMQSLAHIPEIIENAIFITEAAPYKAGTPYDNYKYFVTGIEIDGKEYTVRSVIGEKAGEYYYDHYLTEINKGRLIDTIGINTPGYQSTPSINKDTTLSQILQIPIR
ncbi:hypothetical protein FACS1894163_00570 [Spirochaetia bacterium]|nr:hypothetical protein FACS1894163_00570 [Spirochaetia bacterium]